MDDPGSCRRRSVAFGSQFVCVFRWRQFGPGQGRLRSLPPGCRPQNGRLGAAQCRRERPWPGAHPLDCRRRAQVPAARGASRRRYDGIVLDPPSFGRGANQELFKIDDNLLELLGLCWQVLAPKPLFVFLSCHTPGYTPLVLQHLVRQIAGGGSLEAGEMVIEATPGALPLPSGSYAAWTAHSQTKRPRPEDAPRDMA
jgi:hypothetical protein